MLTEKQWNLGFGQGVGKIQFKEPAAKGWILKGAGSVGSPLQRINKVAVCLEV